MMPICFSLKPTSQSACGVVSRDRGYEARAIEKIFGCSLGYEAFDSWLNP